MSLYGAFVAACAFAGMAAVVALGNGVPSPYAVILLAATAAWGERSTIRLSSVLEGSISVLPTVFAAVAFGPLSAAIVGASSMLGACRAPYLKWWVYTWTRASTGVLAGLVASAADGFTANVIGSVVIATMLSALTAECADAGWAALTTRIRGNRPADVLRTVAPVAVSAVLVYSPLIALLAVAYTEISAWTLPLFLAPAVAAQRLYALYQDQRRLTDDLVAANDRLERANLSFATALVATLDARDEYTAGHSAAVAIYARDIAARLGLSTDDQQLAHLCGLVHDIGKIGLPPGLLEKPGALTLEERREMQRHSEIGERILANVEDYAEIAAIVRHHHERWDGQGYPDGIDTHAIPLLSRIIAVADAYDAMTSNRPYRDAMPSRVARMRLAQAVESQFDTTVVAAFEAILAGADEAYRIGARPDFRLSVQDPWNAAARSAEAQAA